MTDLKLEHFLRFKKALKTYLWFLELVFQNASRYFEKNKVLFFCLGSSSYIPTLCTRGCQNVHHIYRNVIDILLFCSTKKSRKNANKIKKVQVTNLRHNLTIFTWNLYWLENFLTEHFHYIDVWYTSTFWLILNIDKKIRASLKHKTSIS